MKKNLLVLLFFAFVMQAKAAVMIEPYVGYAVNGNIDVSGGSDEDYTGTTLGGRLAWKQLGLFVGGDIRRSTYDVDGDDLTETLYSAVVGYEFPILVRVYGQYILGGEGTIDKTIDTDLSDPSGTILGVGFTGLPFVSLNLEMVNYKYDTVETGPFESDSDSSHYLLSVSLPIDL